MNLFDIYNEDDNSLFREISRLTYGTPNHHKEIKETMCDYIATRYFRFSDFILEVINNYIDQMLDKCTWEDSTKLLYFLSSIMEQIIFMKDYIINSW